MCRSLSVVAILIVCSGTVQAHGLLIPEDKSLPPLAMLNHKVRISQQFLGKPYTWRLRGAPAATHR
jgi:hypothetical protein